ncbi:ribonuclease P protein component [Oxalobacter formigenes]|uniref:Ribonuclease P protein component n=2 Tax=Oxalobacter formigenes TaxID=847 RepID=C3XC39_OXAFO|nr:ribonuclease P protein component [Oxalobacter formigenes]ARQ77374.1 ribonuclease P protein component [Oxalobacter formigenes OXCC13]EEO30765.1 ribonuclease P protein component [Oxalobacter formigenes OXCC13]MCZ4063207.1 ribonuclease P protein component [Oxalobacter formigenes]QDX34091.1 ribonuclease P protein component [Oxalobacter formigenes]WAW01761.1 ribonuclease P protein component [Oxalobacter formigenes]
MNRNFSSDRRIVKTDDFSSVFRMRPRARTKHFVMYARPNQLESARLGIVVAKRFAHRAVTRNTIKRLCRETFRCIQIPAMDCIIRLTSPVNTRKDPATNRQVKRILRAELDQLIASSGMNQKSRQ